MINYSQEKIKKVLTILKDVLDEESINEPKFSVYLNDKQLVSHEFTSIKECKDLAKTLIDKDKPICLKAYKEDELIYLIYICK